LVAIWKIKAYANKARDTDIDYISLNTHFIHRPRIPLLSIVDVIGYLRGKLTVEANINILSNMDSIYRIFANRPMEKSAIAIYPSLFS
jgi:hypothetical protein